MSRRRPAKPSLRAIFGTSDLPPLAGTAADLAICLTGDNPSYFSDDVHTTGAGCGVNMYHRPYLPKRAQKVCPDCALRLGRKEPAP